MAEVTISVADKATLDTVNTNTAATKTTVTSMNTTLGTVNTNVSSITNKLPSSNIADKSTLDTVNTNVTYIKNNMPSGGGDDFSVHTYSTLPLASQYGWQYITGDGYIQLQTNAAIYSSGAVYVIPDVTSTNGSIYSKRSDSVYSAYQRAINLLQVGCVRFYNNIVVFTSAGGSASDVQNQEARPRYVLHTKSTPTINSKGWCYSTSTAYQYDFNNDNYNFATGAKQS